MSNAEKYINFTKSIQLRNETSTQPAGFQIRIASRYSQLICSRHFLSQSVVTERGLTRGWKIA